MTKKNIAAILVLKLHKKSNINIMDNIYENKWRLTSYQEGLSLERLQQDRLYMRP